MSIPAVITPCEFYRRLLGLEAPWQVTAVEIKKLGETQPSYVEVTLNHPRKQKFKCRECGNDCPVADHGKERSWRHLDSMQFMTYLVAAPPRIKCPKCGVKTIELPWAEADSRVTRYFESFALMVIYHCGNIKGAADLLRCDYDTVERIIRRAVKRGLERRGEIQATRLGFDETQWCSGMSSDSFITVLTDLSKKVVLAVVPGKSAEAANKALDCMTDANLAKVDGASTDFAPAYTKTVEDRLPQATHTIDKFHVSQLAHKALDAVRRQELATLKTEEGQPSLKKMRLTLLKSYAKLDSKGQARLRVILTVAKKTAKAHEAKETLTEIMATKGITKEEGEKLLSAWCEVTKRSQLGPLKTLSKTIAKHLDKIGNYFKMPITNAATEGINGKIKKLIADANGIGSIETLATRIFFFHGGLDKEPEGVPKELWHY